MPKDSVQGDIFQTVRIRRTYPDTHHLIADRDTSLLKTISRENHYALKFDLKQDYSPRRPKGPYQCQTPGTARVGILVK